jgi:hypothetical protein
MASTGMCVTCQGGTAVAYKRSKCPRCKGTGKCPSCRGTGKQGTKDCPYCWKGR